MVSALGVPVVGGLPWPHSRPYTPRFFHRHSSCLVCLPASRHIITPSKIHIWPWFNTSNLLHGLRVRIDLLQDIISGLLVRTPWERNAPESRGLCRWWGCHSLVSGSWEEDSSMVSWAVSYHYIRLLELYESIYFWLIFAKTSLGWPATNGYGKAFRLGGITTKTMCTAMPLDGVTFPIEIREFREYRIVRVERWGVRHGFTGLLTERRGLSPKDYGGLGKFHAISQA